ncbi:TlpA disulfide reductase family protein [Pedobacter frigoris]|uniref:TlpA family protein disulfide reductase n=1 Tax=Pedobacter frigoris TaxID=2571272 RepID=UPI00292F5478|nr:TlpA disulfide reductase family protein [Pedobacter frigoris]
MIVNKEMLFIIVILYTSIINQPLFGQLKVNSKAPEIQANIRIGSKPNDVSLKEKFLVLDFWATWCAPCLAALPHLNSLQEKFENQKDLLFLSMTDENENKINKILPHFHFKSLILSDTSGVTFNSYGVKLLPTTFLIDKNNIIRWIGDPRDLTSELLKKFVNGDDLLPISENKKQIISDNSRSEAQYKEYRAIFDNEKITNVFHMSQPDNQHSGKSISKINQFNYNTCQFGIDISTLFIKLLHCSKGQVILPKALKNKAISYCFKQEGLSSNKQGETLLISKITEGLGLKLTKTYETQEVINIKVIDTVKLNKAKASKKKGLMRSGSSISDDSAVIAIYNSSLQVLEDELNMVYGVKIEIEDVAHFMSSFDITLNNSSFESLKKSLFESGFSAKKETKSLLIYHFD